MAICKKCGKEFEGEGIYCTPCRWEMKWPSEILNAPELASRRKRSHSLKMLLLDKENTTAEFQSSRNGKIYQTTLGRCTCKDFALGRGEYPCKHILRLAEELGVFKNEYFISGERDYTLDKNSVNIISQKDNDKNNYDYSYRWRTRWSTKIINSPELTSRRKLSHSVEIISYDKNNTVAVCKDYEHEKIYRTTLTKCTCEDFAAGFGIRPCRHILHLADELKLIQCEYDGLKEYGQGIKIDFKDFDDSKEAKAEKFSIFQEWEELLYGFNTIEEGINFINGLKLTIAQLKEFSQFSRLNVPFSGRKAEIIKNIVDRTTGHSHRQLLRWLADQIYKHKTIEECEKFLRKINITVPQIMEFAEFKHIELFGNNIDELIENLVANTVGKTARYTGNVININLNVDTDELVEKITSEVPAVETIKNHETSTEEIPQKSNIFLKILKFLLSCGMCFFAVMCMVGTISRADIAPKELLLPIFMFLLGIIAAVSAKKSGLQGSMLKWILYGTFVPVVSWFDVLSARYKKHFLMNLFICVIGVLIWLIIFVNVIEPPQARLNSRNEKNIESESTVP